MSAREGEVSQGSACKWVSAKRWRVVDTIRLLDDRQAWLRGNVVDDTGRPRRTDDESVRDWSKDAFLDFPVKDPLCCSLSSGD